MILCQVPTLTKLHSHYTNTDIKSTSSCPTKLTPPAACHGLFQREAELLDLAEIAVRWKESKANDASSHPDVECGGT